jgi:hypothetical protein
MIVLRRRRSTFTAPLFLKASVRNRGETADPAIFSEATTRKSKPLPTGTTSKKKFVWFVRFVVHPSSSIRDSSFFHVAKLRIADCESLKLLKKG